MNSAGTLFIICLFLYCCISWILPRLLAWLFKRRFHMDLHIGRIGIPYLTIHDVHFTRNGVSVHVDEIGFRSSLFSSDVTKLLAVVVKDVRINRAVGGVQASPPLGAPGRPVNLQGITVPPLIVTLAQLMAVHVDGVNAMLLRMEQPECLAHITASQLHLDGSVLHGARTLLVNCTAGTVTAKVLRHPASPRGGHTCLLELGCGIALEASVLAQGQLSLQVLNVVVGNTNVVVNEAFYRFVQERKQLMRSMPSPQLPSRSYVPIDHFLKQLAPVIPKSFSLKLDDGVLRGMADDRTDFHSTLQNLSVESTFSPCALSLIGDPGPDLHLCWSIFNWSIKCNKESVLSLKKLSVDGQLEKDVVSCSCWLDALDVVYAHKDVHPWVFAKILGVQFSKDKSCTAAVPSTVGQKGECWTSLLRRYTFRGSIDLQCVSCMVRLSEDSPAAVAGVSHVDLKYTLYQLADLPELRSAWGTDTLDGRHWSAELLAESAHLTLGSGAAQRLRKHHVWGTPFYLGLALLKLRSQGPSQAKLHAMLETVRAEWSPPLATFLRLTLRSARDYGWTRPVQGPAHTPWRDKYLETCTHCIKLTDVNFFFIADKEVCLMLRLDQTSAETGTSGLLLGLEGARLVSVMPTTSHYTCLRSTELGAALAHVRTGRLCRSSSGQVQLSLLDEVQCRWSTNVHLKLLTLLQELHAFYCDLGMMQVETHQQTQRPRQARHSFTLSMKGQVELHIATSSKHSLQVTSDEVCLSLIEDETCVLSSTIRVAIDHADMFLVEGLRVARLLDCAEVQQERLSTEGFTLAWNTTWGVTVQSLKACFPYEHSFAQAVQGELVSVYKWLKLVHKKQRAPFTADSPLPPDLLIQVEEFLFEMSDDPLEVRLRDNYELLEDEYQENLKRQKMMDAKIAELRKAHLLLPAAKVEELYASLSRKNAEIYIQRSKQMSRAAPPRSRLFAWLMTDVRVMVLADPTLHGTDHAVRVLTEIDADSPWPEEGLEFSTLWCRSVSASCCEWKFQLRDFPQPLLDIGHMHIWGRLVGAEQEAMRRAKRSVVVELGDPWGKTVVERGMTSLKLYHDFNCEIQHYSYAFGPCWEPVIAQCNLGLEKIVPQSQDPSPPLPFWDKMRLLFHGRLTMLVRQMTVLLHASLDPYNTTEEMELTWSHVAMDWTNAKVVFKGELNVYVRTASKYDDCRMLHLPNLKLSAKLSWICLADPNDHHAVMPCAPDKLPEYSSNQEHDSFRAFRSQHLNVSIALETKLVPSQCTSELDYPVVLLYGSTVRWFENLKLILSGVTRPTRRGPVFGNVRPRKSQLSRHYRKLHLLLALHQFQVHYWMSFAKQRGFELSGGRISSSSEHLLTLVPVAGVLKRRPRAEWTIVYMNCDLNDAEIWLKSALPEEAGKEVVSLRQPVEKCYFLSVGKVTYGRETALPSCAEDKTGGERDTPTHRLVVYDLKGAWTKSNRDVAFALFNSFMKTKQLKKNLSTEALKSFRCENTSTPLKSRGRPVDGPLTPPPSAMQGTVQATPSPMSKLQSGHAATMLQQLIAEADNKTVVFSDDLSVQTKEQHLQGLAACQEDDVLYKNWLIVLVNSQVLLKGCETKGYVIVSAAKAEILQRVHRPVWKERSLVSKTTWVGCLECMQYYATVSAGESDYLDEHIMWLTVENIQEKDSTVIADLPDVPHLVGSGQSVGGVVSQTVGASSTCEDPPLQLQRIVSRCRCEFFYAGYGEGSVDPGSLAVVPTAPGDEVPSLWEKRDKAVDAFTLMHHDLDVCTNSLQYAMILDVVNNLVLWVEPRRREAWERLQRMRFQLQLHSMEDQRRPIQQLQTQVRALLSKLRRLEKDTHLVQRALAEEPEDPALLQQMEDLERQVYECKELVNLQSEELDMMLSCYKETQLSANQKLATLRDKPATTVRANEICFKHAQWRLTEADGQLGIADLVLSNFLYTKCTKSDDSGEHLLELGYIRMTNLLPNQAYQEVLIPTEIQNSMPVDRKRAIRIFCREKAPVGGISVKEHFEINVVPLTIGLTKKFFNTMLKFCFPERDPEAMDGEGSEDGEEGRGRRMKSARKSKETNFYVPIEHKDDIEKMKERAEKNKLFIYIKIPEVPVKVSYKGNKEKNIEDIRDFSLVIPTLEYHNVTWTWLDLLLAMKSDSRRVILSQAIKQKLQIKMTRTSVEEGTSPQEEDKARMLFGSRVMPGDSRSLKRSMFKFPK
ncbi:protein hobbit isoform X2 [Bacillus rossius redtenbacheri]|uniref:protein hobbit isoform X2 n=1 Tax=Bacillus rossius redtenbacheri TaxID=93214 RepID=UPI002FDCC4F2